ncbi:virion structural protein [Lactococcus phage CHPC967]|uniref:Capsid and scaffold protein n=1 Tax=Lactococcus phage CHPC967 TaxID=2675259 RepID=A0A650F8E5_9CAUD|nr:virion structural protein [Lactococcus phage CHPC967]QGT53475.1 capsid and scaffold protein [Lactococcus phage CHPC967]
MISWLNFEELLIHNPIELINFSKSNIQVALSKKQYIDFFSNKAVYMGLYYDEEMDFCVMFYADPLQSSKSGEMYAGGYIDVDMKIYRVKVLSNVSISRPDSFDGTQGKLQPDGKYKHTAWANIKLLSKTSLVRYGADNRWTYKEFQAGTYTASFNTFGSDPASGTYKRAELVSEFSFLCNDWDTFMLSKTSLVRYGIDGHWVYKVLQAGTYTANFDLFGSDPAPGVWKKVELVSGFSTFYPTTKSDRPSHIGQYTDTILDDSTNPSFYTWGEAQEEKWNVTKTGMLVSPQAKQITMVQSGTLMKCEINNNITGWTDGTTQLEYSGQDFIIDGYGMRGLHNG